MRLKDILALALSNMYDDEYSPGNLPPDEPIESFHEYVLGSVPTSDVIVNDAAEEAATDGGTLLTYSLGGTTDGLGLLPHAEDDVYDS